MKMTICSDLPVLKKYGGVYVPPHQAVIHQYAREMLAGGGKMILGSDSHTRYGRLWEPWQWEKAEVSW